MTDPTSYPYSHQVEGPELPDGWIWVDPEFGKADDKRTGLVPMAAVPTPVDAARIIEVRIKPNAVRIYANDVPAKVVQAVMAELVNRIEAGMLRALPVPVVHPHADDPEDD